MREVGVDSILTVISIGLYIIEFFTVQPVIKGFVRLRCVLKFPFAYSLLSANFSKKVIIWYDADRRR